MTEQITRVISSDVGEFFCSEGDTLLRAALRAGLGATYECNSGGCGTCKFVATEGEFEQIQPDPPGLSDRDRRKGRQLACQAVPTQDCVVKLSVDPENTPRISPRVHVATVLGVRHLTHDMVELLVQTEMPADFLPGQFAMVSRLSGPSEPLQQLRRERAFSMANVANDDGLWQFLIKEVPEGVVSGVLVREVKVGDKLRLDGPYGHAYLKDTGRDVVCIAGGSGLAPMVSIARGLAYRSDSMERSLLFFYGGRAVRDLCVREFTDEITAFLNVANLIEVLSEADPGTWTGPSGFVHEAVKAAELTDLRDRDIYVAGPLVMTDAVVRLLILDLEVPVNNIHYDRFF